MVILIVEKQVQKTTRHNDTHSDLGSRFKNRNLETVLFMHFTCFECLVIHSCDVRTGCSCVVGQKRPVSAHHVRPLRKRLPPPPPLGSLFRPGRGCFPVVGRVERREWLSKHRSEDCQAHSIPKFLLECVLLQRWVDGEHEDWGRGGVQ